MGFAGYATAYATSLATAFAPGAPAPGAPVLPPGAGFATTFATPFATGYSPGSGGLGSAAPIVPDELVDAVVALVRGSLVADGSLLWFGTGQAESGLLPVATLAEPDESSEPVDTSGTTEPDGHLEVAIYASGKGSARSLGNRMTALLTDAPLLFLAGSLVYLRQSGRSAMQDPDPGPGGEDVWQEVRLYRYMYTHTLGGS